MAAGNRYQLIDQQTFLSQRMLNVYYYEQLSGASLGANLLATLFINDILPLLLPLQNVLVTHTSIDVINIDNDDDYYSAALSDDNVGTSEGDAMPPYAAWAFRYNRATRAVRNGQKRFGGVTENNQVAGVAVGGAIVDLAALAVALGDDLNEIGTILFTPRIFHRAAPAFPGDPTPPLSDGTAHPISSVAYVSLSTQNTRKFGRGI